MENKKKYLIVLLIVIVLSICVVGAIMNSGSKANENSSTTELSTETSNEYTYDEYEEIPEIPEEPTTSLQDLGFYNVNDFVDEYGSAMFVGVLGYSSDEKGAFIYFDPNTRGELLVDGYIESLYNINGRNDYKIGSGPFFYTVTGNNGITYDSNRSILINERVELSENSVVFKTTTVHGSTTEQWYIPATMVKWDTMGKYTNSDGSTFDRIYVK